MENSVDFLWMRSSKNQEIFLILSSALRVEFQNPINLDIFREKMHGLGNLVVKTVVPDPLVRARSGFPIIVSPPNE